MKHDQPLILPIKEIITENSRIKSFVFDYDFPGEPGQFVMTWIPGYDEKPFGIVKREGKGFMITVAAIGPSTKAMHEMNLGDKLGFRGPYGSVFTLPEKGAIAMVAGGYGVAPLAYLAEIARNKGIEVHMFLGARSKDELLFHPWMQEIGVQLHLSTDDGSEGFKGYNTDLFKEYVERLEGGKVEGRRSKVGRLKVKPSESEGKGQSVDSQFTKVYTVGPEIMEMKVTQTCYEHNLPFEVSLERYMKCGFGICGQCCVDPVGWRMCVEGPVLNQDQLKQVEEFGKYHRTASGRIVHY